MVKPSPYKKLYTLSSLYANKKICRFLLLVCKTKFHPLTDLTNVWTKAQANKGTLILRQEYTVNGRSHVVDGKHVKLNPSEREMSIAVLLSEKYGKKVELIPQVMYPQGIQKPDYLIDGERFDLKSPTGKGKNIDITDCPLSMEELVRQAESLYKSRRTGFWETIVFLKMRKL